MIVKNPTIHTKWKLYIPWLNHTDNMSRCCTVSLAAPNQNHRRLASLSSQVELLSSKYKNVCAQNCLDSLGSSKLLLFPLSHLHILQKIELEKVKHLTNCIFFSDSLSAHYIGEVNLEEKTSIQIPVPLYKTLLFNGGWAVLDILC